MLLIHWLVRTIHWSMVYLQGTTPLENTDSQTPRSHEPFTVPHLGARLVSLCLHQAGMLSGLIMWVSHSCREFMNEAVLSCLEDIVSLQSSPTCLLQSFCPLFPNSAYPWGRACHVDWHHSHLVIRTINLIFYCIFIWRIRKMTSRELNALGRQSHME